MNINKIDLTENLKSISCIIAIQDHLESNSLGVSFSYLGVIYTAYCDLKNGDCEVLKHDELDITKVENIGSVNVEILISFFNKLPQLIDILE